MHLVLAFLLVSLSGAASACPLLTDTSYMPPALVADAMRVCTDQGVDVNTAPVGGDPIFRRVIATGSSVQAVQIGLDAGGDPNIFGRTGSPAFVDLVNFAHAESEPEVVAILDLLGAAGADFSRPDNHGDLALSKAAGGGQLDTARVLLRWRADPNGLNTYNRSPLFETVFGGCSPEVGRMLIQNGARIDVMPQDQIDRMFVEADKSCTSGVGQTYVRELRILAGR